MNALSQLRQWTTVVADSGDISAIAQWSPQDATTNPSLILKAVQDPRYATIVEETLAQQPPHRDISAITQDLLVAFALKILAIIPGRVSIEINPQHSFNIADSIHEAQTLIDKITRHGLTHERVLIKIAATWEGICAAQKLEQQGIHCNLTLLFSFAQAQACADAGVQLISPFVGRIYDWYCQAQGVKELAIAEDPGVDSVRRIYHYYKKHGYRTEVMGASFRKIEQILALAGCDLMTISPDLLLQLSQSTQSVTRALSHENAINEGAAKTTLDQSSFLYQHNHSAMAVEKLAEGIRKFDEDTQKLHAWIHAKR